MVVEVEQQQPFVCDPDFLIRGVLDLLRYLILKSDTFFSLEVLDGP